MEDKPLLRSLVPDQISTLISASSASAYRGQQLLEWLFKHDATDWEQMGNLPKLLRQDLAARFELTGLQLQEKQVSADRTRKFLFSLRDGHTIESVIIPMADHATFCLSSPGRF